MERRRNVIKPRNCDLSPRMSRLVEQAMVCLNASAETVAEKMDNLKVLLAIMDDVLDEQRNLPVIYSRDRWAYMDAYLEWIQRSGIVTDKIEMKKLPDGSGVGLFVTDDVPVGSMLISVPNNVIFSLRHLMKRGGLKKVLEMFENLEVMKSVSLAMGLLYEGIRGRSSFWFEYIRFLPSNIDTPLSYTLAEFEALKNTHSFNSAFQIFWSVCRQYFLIYSLIVKKTPEFQGSGFNKNNFTYANYRWAMNAVMSRLNDVSIVEVMSDDEASDGGGGQSKAANDKHIKYPALIPHWDMVNHNDFVPICTDFNPTKRSAGLFSGFALSKGDEVLTYYGNRSACEFMLNAGFFTETNPNLAVVVYLGLNKSCEDYDLQLSAAQSRDLLSGNQYLVYKYPRVNVQFTALMFVLIFVADREQLINLNSSAQDTLEVDDAWIKKGKDYLYTRMMLLAKTRQKTLKDAEEKGVRPIILKYLRMEMELFTLGANHVKVAQWPTFL